MRGAPVAEALTPPPVSAQSASTVSEEESRRANGADWDGYADEYQGTHGDFLGDIGFVWGPEGLTEAEAGMLGAVAGRGRAGAGQRGRTVRAVAAQPGRRAYGLDLSQRQLQHSRRLDEHTGVAVPSRAGPPPSCRSPTTRSTSSSAPSARSSSSPTST